MGLRATTISCTFTAKLSIKTTTTKKSWHLSRYISQLPITFYSNPSRSCFAWGCFCRHRRLQNEFRNSDTESRSTVSTRLFQLKIEYCQKTKTKKNCGPKIHYDWHRVHRWRLACVIQLLHVFFFAKKKIISKFHAYSGSSYRVSHKYIIIIYVYL